jgi:hypothetical protein
MNLSNAPQIQSQDPAYSIVKGCIVSLGELYGPGSGLTITPIEMVSNPSTPEAIEPLQNNQVLRILINFPHPRLKRAGLSVVESI